ncbi:hypothetical protein Leryth_006856 [Lithospermum erythrorhizon]|nr:hypothetical protein Leryth_006856 [Lithospermum erythrorhizon]
MSDLGIYELEDIIWDDGLYQSDDHIVPHPGDEQAKQHSFGCNNRKRTRRESMLEGDAGGSSSEKHICQDRADHINHTIHDKSKMFDKEAWSNKADNVFHSCSSKSISEASSLASNGMKTSDGDSVGYQHCFPDADNDLSFLDISGGKDPNDLLYYSWDDLGNFEDVDRMFRSCDSTFGLGTSQEDDLGWLSPSDAIRESEDALKSDFKFSCPTSSSQKSIPESEDTSLSNGRTCSINESEVQNSSAIFKGSGQLGLLPFSNGISYSDGTDKKDKASPSVQATAVSLTDEPIKKMKLPNQPENHRNDQYVGSSSFFHDANVPGATLQPVETPISHSFGYLHSDTTFMSSDFSFPSDQCSPHPAQSVIKSDNSHLTSVTPKDSYSLNKMQAMDHQPSSLQVLSFAVGEKGEPKNQPKKCQASSDCFPKNIDFNAQTSMSATISNEKQTAIHYSGKSRIDGLSKEVHQELGSSVAQDSSMSSGLDDISIEATSFHQLQLVMEQLDLRTKLCIRDSLYRLARSAEQRHQNVGLNSGPLGDRASMLAEGSTKFPDFMDIETDTNPIDRSIAHLLFHRPADSPELAGQAALSFNSPTPRLIHGSVNTSPSPVMSDAGGVVKHEETAAETDRNVADHN